MTHPADRRLLPFMLFLCLLATILIATGFAAFHASAVPAARAAGTAAPRKAATSTIATATRAWRAPVGSASRSQVASAPSRPVAVQKPAPALKPLVYNPKAKYVALSFDDGPSTYTPRILAILRRNEARATFCELGSQIKRYHRYTAAVAAQGCEVADHSYNHPQFTWLKSGKIRTQIERTAVLIRRYAGIAPHFVRPPYGAVSARVRRVIKSEGYRCVLWDKDTRDWSRPGVNPIIRRATKHVHAGDIILMHDGGGTRSQTVKALPEIIRRLKAKGFTLCTVNDLYRFGVRR